MPVGQGLSGVKQVVRSVRHEWLQLRASRMIDRLRLGHRKLVDFNITDLSQTFSVAVVGHDEYFGPYRSALTDALIHAGASASAHVTLETVENPHAVVIVGPHEHSTRRWRRRGSRSLLIGIQTEQLPTPHQRGFEMTQRRLADYLAWSGNYDLIIEWNREAAAFLQGIGPQVLHLPHGRLDLSEIHGVEGLPVGAETHDLLFLGGLGGPHKRRRHLIRQLQNDFSVHPATGTTVWGVEKLRALQQSRIMLNINSDESMAFPSPRFFETLSLGRPLLSEVVADPWPFIPDVDYLEATRLDLKEAIGSALDTPELLRRTAESGRARASEHSMVRIARRLLAELLALHRAVQR